jgi:hypothetical protein
MKILRFIFLIIAALSFSSCESYMAEILPERPTYKMDGTFINASPEFHQGWRDGCETGMSSGSNTFYKIFYRNNKVDGYKMVGSPEYKTAWSNSYWYCFRHDYIKQKSPIWGSIFGGVM